MQILITLALWLTLLGLAAHWPAIDRRRARMLVLLGALAIISRSGFWQHIIQAAWAGDDLPLLGPAAAFASAWILILPPLWQRRLDTASLASSLFAGLLAMAAIGTALDLGHLVFSRFSLDAGLLAAALMTLMVTALIVTGFVLDLWVSNRLFPWEYAAWCAGWLIIAQPAHPVLVQINPAGDHGLWTLAILLASISCLALSQRSHYPLIWIGSALAIPMGASIAAVS